MATSSMVPYSNPAGKNQTSPTSTLATSPAMTVPTSTPTNPVQASVQNPAVPSTAIAPGNPTVPQTVGTDPNLYQQLQDIYGASGNSLYEFMQKIGGVDSATLQDFIKSLQPQFDKADANLRSSLGAGGVSANSSIAAIGQADLQSQENALIADESAKLLQSQEGLQANLLEGILPDAKEQVADSSGWNTFAQILNGVGGVAGAFMGLGDITGGLTNLLHHGSGSKVPSSGYSLVDSVGV